jgi:hypothetical protein
MGARVAALATSACGRAAGRGLTLTRRGLGAAAGAASSGGSAAKASGRAIGVRRLAVRTGAAAGSLASAPRVSGDSGPCTCGRRASSISPVPRSGAAPRAGRASAKPSGKGEVDRRLGHGIAALRLGRDGGLLHPFGRGHGTVQRVVDIGRDDHATDRRHNGGDGDRRNHGVCVLDANSEHAPDAPIERTLNCPFQIYRRYALSVKSATRPRRIVQSCCGFGGFLPVGGGKARRIRQTFTLRAGRAATGCPQMLVFLKIGSGMLRITAMTIRQIGRT